jgi:hypothetical protein
LHGLPVERVFHIYYSRPAILSICCIICSSKGDVSGTCQEVAAPPPIEVVGILHRMQAEFAVLAMNMSARATDKAGPELWLHVRS